MVTGMRCWLMADVTCGKENWRRGGSLQAASGQRDFRKNLLLLLEHRETRALVLDHFHASRQGVEGSLGLHFTREEVEGHFLSALELLAAVVEVVGFLGFFGYNGECHDLKW